MSLRDRAAFTQRPFVRNDLQWYQSNHAHVVEENRASHENIAGREKLAASCARRNIAVTNGGQKAKREEMREKAGERYKLLPVLRSSSEGRLTL